MAKKKIKKFSAFLFPVTFIFAVIFLFFSIDIFFFTVRQGNQNCANTISCAYNLNGNYESTRKGVFMNKVVYSPPFESELANLPAFKKSNVLGTTTSDTKRIFVDLTNQKLYAFENGNLVFNFTVSTGKWNPTPTGDFRIWIKLRYTRMTGGDKAKGDYYDLPNVPFTMFFYNNKILKSWGYSLHGAYWHNNFGHPMSHGCVNMKIADAEQLYNWANPPTQGYTTYTTQNNPGTLITIYGVTPVE